MAVKIRIKKNCSQDALRLMRISESMRDMEGVENAVAVMATDKAKFSLEDSGLMTPEIEEAGDGDLVMVAQANSEGAAEDVLDKMEQLISALASKCRSEAPDILNQEILVINVGLEIFKEALDTQGVKALHVSWKIPAGGDMELVNILKKMS